MKIAIVGSGISGMVCGHMLSPHHDVELFEAENRIGGHTHTVDVEVASGKYAIDTGFIVFNQQNYPNFIKLMDSLGVKSQPSYMSFSVKIENYNLEYNGTTLNTLFCQRKNIISPSFWRMIKDILRFNKQATKLYVDRTNDPDHDLTLEQWLAREKYSEQFIEHYIIPMGAAIWSANREEMRRFPLHFFVRFFHHHGLLTVDEGRPDWRVLIGGSHSYIPKLTANFKDQIRLNSPVKRVTRENGKVQLTFLKAGIEETKEFDQVIFASHGNQSLKILQDPSDIEKKVMGSFSYRPNDVILHTDTSVLPKSKLGTAAWNYYLPKSMNERLALTYNMNILQTIKSPETFLVSLNMEDFIDPKKIIKKIPYSHPVYNAAAVKAHGQWDQVSGVNNTHFCGAYWGNGFHEDGVKTALKVVSTFGISL